MVEADDMVASWSRDTPWRQGCVLTAAAAQELELSHPDAPESTCVVVISHDCDLANDNLHLEPNVEVIVGRTPDKPSGEGNYFWAKSPRTLHIEVQKNGADAYIELVATDKKLIPKQQLAAFSPDETYEVSGKSLGTLRAWLSVRYNRAAYPDPFITLLSKNKVDRGLANIVEPVGKLLLAVYFDVDGGEARDHSDNTPYLLSIILAYLPGDDPEQTADTLDDTKKKIADLFGRKFFEYKTEKWNGIQFLKCSVISVENLTVSKAMQLTQWRLEYLSLKADEDSPGSLE